MNILASTSRQLNPGDDFVLQGIRNLYPANANWVVYNRNPDSRMLLGNQWVGGSLEEFDEIVIAGTPQWYGDVMNTLYDAVLAENKPIRFLGIGIGEAGRLVVDLTPAEIKVLKNAKVVTTRGQTCSDQLYDNDIESVVDVCPALFAHMPEELWTTVTPKHLRIGCVLTAKHHARCVPDEFLQKQVDLYKSLGGEVIVHHSHELKFACENFENVRYSYDPRDYEDIYSGFHVIVSSRLHGAIYGLSHGKPSFLIDTESLRCQEVVPQFPVLDYCEPEEVEAKLADLDITQKSQDILAFKRDKMLEYREKYIQ